MNPDQISAERKRIEAKIKELKLQIEDLWLDLKKVQNRCGHQATNTRHHYDGSSTKTCVYCKKEI